MINQRLSAVPFLAVAAFAFAQAPTNNTPVFINEVVIDSRGSNLTELEFIELFTPQPNTSLAGVALISVIGNPVPSSQLEPGHVLHTIMFSESAKTDARGFFLIANQRAAEGYGVTPDLLIPEGTRLTNEPQTFALVRSSEAPAKGALLTTSTRFPSGVLDAVALNDAKQGNVFFFNAPIIGPDREFVAAGAARVRDGLHTGDKSDWALADIDIPPASYNSPRSPNKAGAQVILADARTPVPSGAGTTPAPATPPPPADANAAVWRNYDPFAVEQALEQEGTVLVYARSSTFAGCPEFERSYLLIPSAQPLLAGRPTFYLNVNLPGNGRLATDMGIYKVPTLAFRRRGGSWEYLVINSEATPQAIYEFLKKR
jgi:hypothetical protein